MACWDKTKVHVAGVPLSSVVDCRLVVPFGCDDVGVGGDVVGDGKAQLVLLPFGLASELVSGMSNPRLRLVWKRGPLAPVVVVGEGQAS